jgi:hypothetical protein
MNTYKNSSYYKEHYDYWNCGGATWRFGTSSSRKADKQYRRWMRKTIKEFNAEEKYNHYSRVNEELKKIDIETDDEFIDKILSNIYNIERPKAKWYWFD